MRKSKKLFLFVFFAVISTLLNLLTQRVILYFDKTNLYFFIAIISGTLVGLVVKFYLDKNYIFFDNNNDSSNLKKKFGLYTLMGTFSTMIFWGTESIFWIIWRNENMRELGAVLGLTIGYIIKYRLDKRYVFRKG
tara:strand:- start:615 stop:1019 length:405 start_codon:yes stop_codon:yes gene_type:complete